MCIRNDWLIQKCRRDVNVVTTMKMIVSLLSKIGPIRRPDSTWSCEHFVRLRLADRLMVQ